MQICYRLNRSLLEFLTQVPEQSIHVTTANVSPSLRSPPRAESKFIDMRYLEQQLEMVLLNHECPPPPMEQVARQLRIHRETIFRLFPDLCRAISARYDQFQKIRHHRVVEQSRQEVKQAVLKLCSEGLNPSEGRVAQLMSKPGYLRYKQVRAAIEETKSEFNAPDENPTKI